MIQTFLPYPDFTKSVQCLDDKRLFNQLNEVKVILKSLVGWTQLWKNPLAWHYHPAVKMWRGYEAALGKYGCEVQTEIMRRNSLSLLQKNAAWESMEFFTRIYTIGTDPVMPPWFGDERLHGSHRAALLSKDFGWYGQFGWTESAVVDYHWPI